MTTETVRRCATIMDGDRHEFLQADGSWGRCGGPRFCRECNRAADSFQCEECPMADPGECLKASHCPHRDGPLAEPTPAQATAESLSRRAQQFACDNIARFARGGYLRTELGDVLEEFARQEAARAAEPLPAVDGS